jgi:hypothetical protein
MISQVDLDRLENDVHDGQPIQPHEALRLIEEVRTLQNMVKGLREELDRVDCDISDPY